MLLKLIACNVFLREACFSIAQSPHVIDPDFLELGEHAQSDRLRRTLQARIDATEQSARKYDAILLLYGLCGNAVVGLHASRTRLVVPRAHDCCTILLGSGQRFEEHFGDNPSRPFGSIGYLERGDYFLRTDLGEDRVQYGDPYAALVEQYGEENARYVWEAMHPPALEAMNDTVTFINIPETAQPSAEQRFRDRAAAEGKECLVLEGSLRLIRKLLHGDWDAEEFLVIEPGQKIAGVYDWRQVVRAEPIARDDAC
ncbi:MAG: DUF1638 domain-containing protein [Planctomycetes bacterium]|nr:DUF1638 domain-containing protein [Planctomycetota bacterium]